MTESSQLPTNSPRLPNVQKGAAAHAIVWQIHHPVIVTGGTSEMNDSTTERASYSIRHPLAERPHFCMDGGEYVVVDCSEGGLRFVMQEGNSLPPGTEIGGQIRFRRGAVFAVCGTVVRVTDNHVAVQFTTNAFLSS